MRTDEAVPNVSAGPRSVKGCPQRFSLLSEGVRTLPCRETIASSEKRQRRAEVVSCREA